MLMRHLVDQAGMSDEFEIDSCATSLEEIGNDIYPPAKTCLRSHNVPFSRHHARQITRRDYDYFDAIFCMDDNNLRNLRFVLGNDLMQSDAALAQPKICKLLSTDVADPWYTNDFEQTYRDVLSGCQTILERYTT